jgi:hypothetical protein
MPAVWAGYLRVFLSDPIKTGLSRFLSLPSIRSCISRFENFVSHVTVESSMTFWSLISGYLFAIFQLTNPELLID